ncbi:hypothetical protein JVT61DRAFT_8365 [Boletus reticuloceps]|uniref:Uncharacterized protein n=1 Tax=Boletus reticuloceps TaxID=495285 RepID=A0A8I2YVW7_9AGAM|nr:hypothetical protein JVT61DRAFT_8365 [Boletus reticuloceps]
MPNCPKCLKDFSSQKAVSFHISQPRSRCYHSNLPWAALEVPRPILHSESPQVLG